MRITPIAYRILEELFLAEYHTLESLCRALAPASESRISALLGQFGRRDYIYRKPLYPRLDSRGSLVSTRVYMLGLKGLDELEMSDQIRNRARPRVRAGKDVSDRTLKHDVLRSKFRSFLLARERKGDFGISRWTLRTDLDLVVHYNDRELRIRPDAFFSLTKNGKERHYFLEVDQASYPVERSDPGAGSSIGGKFEQYASLMERDRHGQLWRLNESALDIAAFSVVHFIREVAPERRDHPLKRQRMESSKRLLERSKYSAARRFWRFLYEDELHEQHFVQLENWKGEQLDIMGGTIDEDDLELHPSS